MSVIARLQDALDPAAAVARAQSQAVALDVVEAHHRQVARTELKLVEQRLRRLVDRIRVARMRGEKAKKAFREAAVLNLRRGDLEAYLADDIDHFVLTARHRQMLGGGG